jgi:hypothetical protein
MDQHFQVGMELLELHERTKVALQRGHGRSCARHLRDDLLVIGISVGERAIHVAAVRDRLGKGINEMREDASYAIILQVRNVRVGVVSAPLFIPSAHKKIAERRCLHTDRRCRR